MPPIPVFNREDMHTAYGTPYGTAHFNNQCQRNIIRLSGGLDSAIALWFAVRTNPDAEFYPFTVMRTNPTDQEQWNRVDLRSYVENIIDYVRADFPQAIIHDSVFQNADYWWIHTFENGRNESPYGWSQSVLSEYFKQKLCDNYRGLVIEYTGLTANPPHHLLEPSDEQHRDELDPRTVFEDSVTCVHDDYIKIYYQYNVWRNADKRLPIWLANQHGILDDLVSITRTCEGDQWNTQQFTQECMECWWCKEKYWALEAYDKN